VSVSGITQKVKWWILAKFGEWVWTSEELIEFWKVIARVRVRVSALAAGGYSSGRLM